MKRLDARSYSIEQIDDAIRNKRILIQRLQEEIKVFEDARKVLDAAPYRQDLRRPVFRKGLDVGRVAKAASTSRIKKVSK